MADQLSHLQKQITEKRDLDAPPLHLWHPELSGDIDIRIDAEGVWYHEGDRIERAAIVNVFSKILRRESDDDYYLVTPVEKWRISVELHPLMVVDVNSEGVGEEQMLNALLNTGKSQLIDAGHVLTQEPRREMAAVLALDHGLTALFTRAAWYRLVEMADEDGELWSSGTAFKLS